MKRLTTLTLQYYRTLLIYNITFTILCVFLIGFSGAGNPVTLFFAKFAGFAGAVGLHYFSSAKTYFYYRNAGMAIRRLYVYAFTIDVIVFILITMLIALCRHLR
nr:hypothetical protein [Mucilaginibacter sp. L294]